ncbi:MAG: carnitine dehydratase [Gammaproteobacteria bacterium]|nr:MAG: carnitine dehydratase [Gammaproteobacteria bacterium]
MLMGPLSSIKIIEIAGIGPGPMCAMLLADLGAEVIRIDRVQEANLGLNRDPTKDVLLRGRRSIAVDLKKPEGIELVLQLIEKSDALTEGFRPGVMERLGLSPEVCHQRNPKLVYGRMTGWGQDGPLSHAAGHDINYISLVGALDAIGREGEAPIPPLNLVGDFGGGALYLAMGVLAGVIEAQKSGQGQVVDCAMTDGSASLMSMFYGMKGMGRWSEERGTNVIDTGSHYYNVYKTKDDKYISIASIEPKFYQELIEKSGLSKEPDLPKQTDDSSWGPMKERLTTVFLSKTRDQWCEIMEGSDVCFAPVLNMEESIHHPHNVARGTFIEIDGVYQPAPAPRFDKTPCEVSKPPSSTGQDSHAILNDWGFDSDQIQRLTDTQAIKQT